jgi:septal ring factor EnvC (AmiA/AmiB activator)
MSRTDDMEFIDQQLQELQDQIHAIAEEHQKKYDEMSEQIQAIIRDAGIFDEVSSLEKERAALIESNQALITDIQTKGQDLMRTRAFLEKRADSPADKEAPAEEAEPERKAVVKKKAVHRKSEGDADKD